MGYNIEFFLPASESYFLMSDREAQFKEFKAGFTAFCIESVQCLATKSSSAAEDIAEVLQRCVVQAGDSYRTFPLLCSRTPQRFAESGTVDGLEDSEAAVDAALAETAPTEAETGRVNAGNGKGKEKKKGKKRPPLPAWKRQLQERRGLRKELEAEEEQTSGIAAADVCRRTVAVAYNCKLKTVRWGLSGQLKNQRIHGSIWGKSLIKGRPRGTCAEFHVFNEALLVTHTRSCYWAHCGVLPRPFAL